jgi:hypothetical protein
MSTKRPHFTGDQKASGIKQTADCEVGKTECRTVLQVFWHLPRA